METLIRDTRLVTIGKSKGIRLPQFLLKKYGITNWLLLEETERGILLRKKDDKKLSYEETYKAIAEAQEDWTDFDQALLDGLEKYDFNTP
ncbi:MAG: AbrB/MazE/SpoVT family DNA-binding domain-containing protein [Pseudomonadota bacterium]